MASLVLVLKKSLFNYMHGVGFDFPLSEWFDFKVSRTRIRPNFIEQCLANEALPTPESQVPNHSGWVAIR